MTKRYLLLILILFPHLFFANGIFGFSKRNKSDKKGERHGKWVYYWDDAKKIRQSCGYFNHGLAAKRWKYYSIEGKISKKEKYNRDCTVIFTKTYHPNGKLEYKGHALLVNDKSSLHYYWCGNWKYFSEKGKYLKTEVYEMGILKSEFE